MKGRILGTVLLATTLVGGSCIVQAEEPVNVKMAVWASERSALFDEVMNNFNAEHEEDGITLAIEMQSGDYSDALGTWAATGEYPDVFILTPYAQVQQFAANGRIGDLSSESFTERVYKESLASSTYDGKIYGYPANYEYLGVFYNKTIFEENGLSVPTTADEFKTVCEKLKDAGITPIASSWKESWTLKHLLSMLVSPYVSDDMQGFVDGLNDGTCSFDEPWMEEIFNFCDIVKENSGDNMMDQDSTSAFTALATGGAAMAFTGEFSLSVNYAMDNPQEIGVFAVPVSNDAEKNKLGVDVGIVYVLNANTDKLDACKEVFDYLSDPDDPNGYVVLSSCSAGDPPPAMPFDGGYPCPASEDYQNYVNEGKTCPWVYQLYTNGFDVSSGDILQGYFADTYSREEVIENLNVSYAEFVEANE